MKVYIHGNLHYMQNMDTIINRPRKVQNDLNENIH